MKHGHEVKILTTDKDVTLSLLDAYGFDYEIYRPHQKSIVAKMCGLISCTTKALAIARQFKPDILIAGTPYLAYVSKILRKPHIMLTDTDHANLVYWLTSPFTDVICTPSCFKGKINSKKHATYNGYEELAYLHPNYFEPDPTVLEEIGLNKNDKYTILRFVAWTASHDIGDYGFTDKNKLVKMLERYGKVFITSETKLPIDFEKYRITIPPHRIHHLMYYAGIFIGESASMAAESAILGTPAIFVSTSRRGYTDELESKYDMLYTFSDSHAQEKAMNKAIELMEDENIKKKYQKKREKLLNEKIDVTKFMTNFIENYPESFYNFKIKKGST